MQRCFVCQPLGSWWVWMQGFFLRAPVGRCHSSSQCPGSRPCVTLPPAHSPLTPADRLGGGVHPPPPGLGVSPTDLGETPSSACLLASWWREYLLSRQGRGQAPLPLRAPALVCPCRLSVRASSYLPTWNMSVPPPNTHTYTPALSAVPSSWDPLSSPRSVSGWLLLPAVDVTG